MRGGDIHGRTSFVILCNASMKRNRQSAITYTLLCTYTDISGGKAKINLHDSIHADQLSNAISPPSWVFLRSDIYIHVIVHVMV